MSSFEKVLFQVDQAVARITLNRPQKRNALDGQILDEIKESLRLCASDQNVRVVLLTGAGKDFCSGADLESLRNTSQAGVLELIDEARALAELFQQMRRHPRPIIAAVRGRALAGGCGLATAADIILAAESAQFGYPEVNVGFVPAMVTAILRRSISEKKAFELIATGEIVTAVTALEIGLINRLFPDDHFDDDAEIFAAKLAGKSASALTLSKKLLYHMDAMSFETAVDAGLYLNVIARMTEDCKREVSHFLDRNRKTQKP